MNLNFTVDLKRTVERKLYYPVLGEGKEHPLCLLVLQADSPLEGSHWELDGESFVLRTLEASTRNRVPCDMLGGISGQ